MTNKPELQPCPFCGGKPTAYEGRHTSSIKCDNGHAIHVYKPTLAAAIAAWNTRATPAQPDASALVEALIRIRDLPDLDRPITDHLQASNYATQVARAALAAYRGGDNG